MDYLKNIEWTPLNIAKTAALALLALLVINVALSFMTQSTGLEGGSMSPPSTAFPSMMQYDEYGADGDYRYAEDAIAESAPSLSVRNITPNPVPDVPAAVGSDAEAFEVTSYSARIETRNSDRTCDELVSLKTYDFVIFLDANEHDTGCSYTFKVAQEHADDVLTVVRGYDPKRLSEHTYTIKSQIEDFTSATDALERKLETIEATLEDAIVAYDEITALARSTENADSLAKVINSKINTLERLTQERINVVTQLEQLARAKAEQLDRLAYTHFTVRVYENKYVNGEMLSDSWKQAVQFMIRDMNTILQNLSVNLVVLVLYGLQFLLYFFIVLIVGKHVWRMTKQTWRQ